MSNLGIHPHSLFACTICGCGCDCFVELLGDCEPDNNDTLCPDCEGVEVVEVETERERVGVGTWVTVWLMMMAVIAPWSIGVAWVLGWLR